MHSQNGPEDGDPGRGFGLARAYLANVSALANSQSASKTRQDAFFICIMFLMPVGADFLPILIANLAPTCLPKSKKMCEKAMPRAIPI